MDSNGRTTAGSTIDHWSHATAALAGYGIDAPHDADTQAGEMIAPFAVAVWREPVSPDNLVDAWRATRGRGDRVDAAVTLAVLLAFDSAFLARHERIAQALAVRRMTIQRTRIEIDLQLGGRLFQLGRAQSRSDRHATTARALLGDAVERLTAIVPREQALGEAARRGYRGMLGIAAVLLARVEDDAGPLLSLAEQHLAEAERLGDHSAGHFAYLLEAQVRRFELSGDLGALAAATATWTRIESVQGERGLLTAGARLHAAHARERIDRGDAESAVEELKQAERLLTQAVDTPTGGAVDDGFVRALRGRVRHQLFEHDTSTDGRRRARWLTLAEEDFDADEARPHVRAGARLPVLLDRVRRLQRRGDHQQALALLETVESPGKSGELPATLAEQIEVARLDSRLFVAVGDGDVPGVESSIDALLSLRSGASTPAAALALGIRFLIARGRADVPAVRAVERLTAELARLPLTPAARRHIAGHAARLAWLLARASDSQDALDQAAALFRESLGAGIAPASPMLLADAGSCALRLAKRKLAGDTDDLEEYAGLLQDAARWLHGALARAAEITYTPHDSFDAALLHSRAGETFLRLHAVLGSDDHLSAGIAHLEAARNLGHPWPELSGHLGDALYRRGRRMSRIDDLQAALALKDEDHADGRTARENRSVAAAASLELHRITQDTQYLRLAEDYALQAAAQDPDWPWPALQLAAVVHQGGERRREPGEGPSRLRELLAREDAAGLERLAAELAARSPEFAPASLGGQQREGRAVYVLADPHELLSRTLVLKRLSRESAQRELNNTTAFAAYLTSTGAPGTWRLPAPLAVIAHATDPDKAVYVMRREKGVPLGLAAATHAETVAASLEQTIKFLAAFYAWAASELTVPPVLPAKRIKRWNVDLFQRSRKLGLSGADARRLASGFSSAAGPDLRALAKRDAHAANWLIAADGGIVAIDLEATSTVPPIFEIAQLLDDFPFLTADDRGWRERLRLCALHLDELRARGVDVALSPQRVDELLAWFALLHAVANLRRLGEHENDRRRSSSGLELRRERRAHTVRLLQYLGEAAGPEAVRRCAARLAAGDSESSRQ